MPVIIMATVAFSLAVWGLWSSTPQPTDEATLPITTQNQKLPETKQSIDDSSISSNTEAQQNLQEIPLDFQHTNSEEVKQNKPERKKQDKTSSPDQANISNDKISNSNTFLWKKTKIRSGDSMAKIFKRLKFSPSDLHAMISIGKTTAVLKNIKPGKILQYSANSEKKLQGIQYSIDKLSTLTVEKAANKWVAIIDVKKVEVRQARAKGTINNSLFLSGKEAGLTDAMVMELAGIFGWDIDFILDIRQGDSFKLIYEEKYVESDKIGNGNILAAEFINQKKSYKALYYKDSTGHAEYYTPSGLSMRKAFLRAPVDFSYISSSFKPRRFHPILKRVKAHNGVDYRAPKGTPVKASGDGKVIRSAYSKYNGHHVFIQHGQKYVTKYLHFTKRNVRKGQRVKQGQIIGYVGSTGLAEAPHLHYEFLVNGVHRNPRTIKLPDAAPINKKEKSNFITQTRLLLHQLEAPEYNAKLPLPTAD